MLARPGHPVIIEAVAARLTVTGGMVVSGAEDSEDSVIIPGCHYMVMI